MNKIFITILLVFFSISSGEVIKKEEPNHYKPMLLSMFIPAGGQFYNEVYLKGGIFLAGEIGLGYGIYYQEDKRREYRDLLKELERNIDNYNESEYDRLKKTYESRKDQARKNRDRFIWITAAWHLLSIGDAYVDSYFKDFKKELSSKKDKALSFVPENVDFDVSYNSFSIIYRF